MSACNIPQNSIAVSLGIDWHGSSKQEAVKTSRLFFGQIRTLELRSSARIVQTGRFAFSPNAQASAYLRRIHTTLRKRHSGSVTGIVCPRLTIGDPYSGSNRQRGSIRVINQNAGTENTEATDAQGRAGVGRKRGVLNDTYRHVQSADNSTSGEIGLIDECAVEEGGIAHAWRTRRAPVSGTIPSCRGAADPGKVSIHFGICSRRESGRQQRRSHHSQKQTKRQTVRLTSLKFSHIPPQALEESRRL